MDCVTVYYPLVSDFPPQVGQLLTDILIIHSTQLQLKSLLDQTLEERFVEALPERLIGDKACDSDGLDQRLSEQGIELIAPHRRGRVKKPTQDGRKLHRYKCRWKVERFFAWVFNYRRCVVRHENKAQNFKAIILLACIMILLKLFLHL